MDRPLRLIAGSFEDCDPLDRLARTLEDGAAAADCALGWWKIFDIIVPKMLIRNAPLSLRALKVDGGNAPGRCWMPTAARTATPGPAARVDPTCAACLKATCV